MVSGFNCRARVVSLVFLVGYQSKVRFEQACSTCPIPFQEPCLGEVVQPINHFDTFTVSRLVSTTLIPRSGPGTRSHRAGGLCSWECLCPFWRDQHTFRESGEEFYGAWQVRDNRGECDLLVSCVDSFFCNGLRGKSDENVALDTVGSCWEGRDDVIFKSNVRFFGGLCWKIFDGKQTLAVGRTVCPTLALVHLFVLLQRSPGKVGRKRGAGQGRFLLEGRDDLIFKSIAWFFGCRCWKIFYLGSR